MRILFLSSGNAPDYQCDMLFHGLRQVEGTDVVDVNRLWYMYRQDLQDDKNNTRELYGRGFSIYGLLGSDVNVDRDDILDKIRFSYFDLVIFGSIWRCRSMADLVIERYAPWKIIFVDGEDEPHLLEEYLGRGLYFKRELINWRPGIWPIQFAIPRQNITTEVEEKVKITSFMDPRYSSTYIYDTQEEYYADYAESFFAVTTKKAGWDCLRHYEIMANKCIPLFVGIEECPLATMIFLPKLELRRAKNLFEAQGAEFFQTTKGRSCWEMFHRQIHPIFSCRCTTEALARYVLDAAAGLRGRL